MVKYLISAVNTVRVHNVADVEALHEELSKNPNFTLSSFSYKTFHNQIFSCYMYI